MAGISREYLNRMETGKVRPSKEVRDRLMEALEKFNPDNPLTMLFDYVRIRFPTTDVQHVIHDILKLNIKYIPCMRIYRQNYRTNTANSCVTFPVWTSCTSNAMTLPIIPTVSA